MTRAYKREQGEDSYGGARRVSENFQHRLRTPKKTGEMLVSALLGRRQERGEAKDLNFKSAISQAEIFT